MGRREDNKARKLERLEEVAMHRFLEYGYHRTSIEQIVADAGIARGTFYLYFPDKAAIFKHLANQLLTPVLDCLERSRLALQEATTIEQTQAVYLDLSSTITLALLGHTQAALLYYRELRDPGEIGEWLRVRAREFDEVVTELVRDLMDRRMLRSADPRVVAMAIVGSIDKLAWAYLTGQDFGDQTQVGATLVSLFGQGLLLPERTPDEPV